MMKKLTTEEYIKKTLLVHGDKYGYDQVEYVNTRSKIKIDCLIHGIFEQKPYHHLGGQGCHKCAGQNKTTEEFIKEANIIHGNIYYYSLSEFEKMKNKIKIICFKHGIFYQRPSNHLIGQGCPKCDNKNKTTEEFIKEAKKMHGDKYDYQPTEYVHSKLKIKIICYIHGVFEQRPNNHLMGGGCPKCDNKNVTLEEFINKAKLVHGDKYDYSLTEYENSKSKIKIICCVHGIFELNPNSHLMGRGCPKCNKMYINTENFIKRANLIHNNLYDYSSLIYINAITKVIIICKIHGEFEQVSCEHLRGSGCPLCYESKGELIIRNLLDQNCIEYIRGKKFDNCRGTGNIKRMLSFDFYLPKYNLLIEYDGEQHFKIVNYWGGKEGFKLRQINDEIKNVYAKNQNIKLLRIKYTEIKNIEKILNDYLKVIN